MHAIQGDRETWDQWPTIRKANPLCNISPAFRKKLLEERDAARADSRLKARFLSYRLNVPTGDESTMLLTADDWDRVTARAVPERVGRPLVGIDLGGGRAWSTAVGMWETGRSEAIAVAPGLPSIAEQEKRDRVRTGTYRKLVRSGALGIAEGLPRESNCACRRCAGFPRTEPSSGRPRRKARRRRAGASNSTGRTSGDARAAGLERYESGEGDGPRQFVIAGDLGTGPVLEFHVPDRNLGGLYSVRVIEVAGEDHGLLEPDAYRAAITSN